MASALLLHPALERDELLGERLGRGIEASGYLVVSGAARQFRELERVADRSLDPGVLLAQALCASPK